MRLRESHLYTNSITRRRGRETSSRTIILIVKWSSVAIIIIANLTRCYTYNSHSSFRYQTPSSLAQLLLPVVIALRLHGQLTYDVYENVRESKGRKGQDRMRNLLNVLRWKKKKKKRWGSRTSTGLEAVEASPGVFDWLLACSKSCLARSLSSSWRVTNGYGRKGNAYFNDNYSTAKFTTWRAKLKGSKKEL